VPPRQGTPHAGTLARCTPMHHGASMADPCGGTQRSAVTPAAVLPYPTRRRAPQPARPAAPPPLTPRPPPSPCCCLHLSCAGGVGHARTPAAAHDTLGCCCCRRGAARRDDGVVTGGQHVHWCRGFECE
jgi:hypothetical protein